MNALDAARNPHFTQPTSLPAYQLWCSWRRRVGEFGLYEHLLDVVGSSGELLIQSVHFADVNAVAKHDARVQTAVLQHLEEFFPVEVDGSLAVADKADAALHDGTDIEVVGL